MIIAWTLYFLFASFAEQLPWKTCGAFTTEEMYAILRACHYINDLPQPPTRVVIFSDSKSALTALQNGSRNREELQTEILFLCHQIIASGTELTLMYIPSHTGIRGCFEDTSVITKCTSFDGVWFNSSCVINGSVSTDWTLETNNTSNRTAFGNHLTNADYFTSNVLDITKGIDDMGTMRWKSALCLLLAWILVSMCMAKGIKTSGKAMYFMAIFPYIALTILLIRGLTLDGSVDGIAFFFLPDWNQLLNTKVWCDAAVQIFYSLAPCTGGLITLSSYNKFKNNCLLDAILISIIDSVTSIFSGLVIFAVLGYMAQELQVDIKDVAAQGAGLAFVVYPEVMTKMPISQLWAVIFFAMLASVGLGSQIANVTTIQTTLVDQFPHLFQTGRRSWMLLGLIAVFCYLIGLVFCFRGGMYVLQLFDNYAASYSVLFIGLVECVALSWIYGTDRILDNMESMLGRRPSKIWTFSWKYFAPIGLAGILIFSCVNFVPTKYGDYIFPGWAEVIGLLLTLSSVMAVLGVAVFKIFKMKRTNSVSLLKLMFLSEKHYFALSEKYRFVSTSSVNGDSTVHPPSPM
ncbi:sodium- and chloride-dependent glycine transporter 2-like [Littorina saxatilis]|uniref:sodium- and chloride-dependent glycine transporter 2-like n=1 Tax=Littorina saxatilis TaxID=31220 RepID=UPI0038B69485